MPSLSLSISLAQPVSPLLCLALALSPSRPAYVVNLPVVSY